MSHPNQKSSTIQYEGSVGIRVQAEPQEQNQAASRNGVNKDVDRSVADAAGSPDENDTIVSRSNGAALGLSGTERSKRSVGWRDESPAVKEEAPPQKLSSHVSPTSTPMLLSMQGEEPADDHHQDGAPADATWYDVYQACCCHTASEWLHIWMGILALLFLLGLELLSSSFRVVGGCTAESLLGSDTNPLAGVMIGIIATAILQSSSTTTAIVVSLVSGGLDVNAAIYLVMGANIGTSVTSMFVSIAHMGDIDELQRAFAGASVVWVFKVLTVVVLFPLEIATGYLYEITKRMLPSEVGEGEKWEGPIKKIVSPLGNKIIIANKDMIEEIAESGGELSCSDYYPATCQGGESYGTCETGLIACDKKTGDCPVFFQDGATKDDDMLSGWICLVFALFLLIACLIGLVALLRTMLLGASQRIIYKATNINGYLAIVIGCGATVLVQSSSITISTLIPLVGMGVLSLEQMYPLTLGADIGTTFTALMAAMVSNSVNSLQVALVHLFFNLNGIVMWYPLPVLRRIPLQGARRLGKGVNVWRALPIAFIVVSFYLLPLILIGISACFDQGTRGFTALGIFLVVLLGLSLLYFVFWWKFRSGKDKCRQCMDTRYRRRMAIRNLAEDMDYLKVDMEYVKNEIGRLKDLAGLVRRVSAPPRPERPSAHAGSSAVSLLEQQDETISLYESCRSKTWADILLEAARTPTEGSLRLSYRLPRSRRSIRTAHSGTAHSMTENP